MLVDDASLARLAPTRFGRLEQLDETTSTNAVALSRAARGEPEGLVVMAEYQSAGRGRLDRSWEAPRGTSLLFSALMRPSPEDLAPSRQHLAVAALSLAIADAVAAVARVPLELKWPNDLLGQGAKVAGLLGQKEGEALVVGAGVNVSWAPPDLPATCLQQLAGGPVDRSALLVAILEGLDRLYGGWEEVSRRYRAECGSVGRQVVVTATGGRVISGVAEEVNELGQLVVRDGDTYYVVLAGDVVHAAVAPPSSL